MKVVQEIESLKSVKRPVVTIGSFDGVHTAHIKIIEKVKKISEELRGESVVVSFDPHPRQVIYPQAHDLELLTTRDEKIKILASLGIDYLLLMPFSIDFSRMSPEEYIEKFIIRGLHPKAIVLGYDHRFGLNREGDIELLREYSREGKYELYEIPKQIIDERTISSSEIRRALKRGDIEHANEFLTRPYTLKGKVIRGMQIGRTLGFPTANIRAEDPHKLIPAHGTYAVEIRIDEQMHRAMMYIGKRATLAEHPQTVMEIHIFDFDGDIYGKELEVFFKKFIREDQKFDDIEALKQAIENDAIRVRAYFDSEARYKHLPQHQTAVVILNYNGLEYLKQFLPGVKEHLGKNHNIVIADNASTDDSLKFLSEEHPKIQVVKLDKNYGFAGGYNKALEAVEADYYVLLNSDIEVDNDWVSPIVNHMEADKTIACAQPGIMSWHEHNKLEYAGAAGGFIDILGYPFCRGRILETTEEDEGKYKDEREVFWATGAAMVIRSALFKNVGGFDEWFFAHQEEIDLCWRLKRAGYKVMVYPEHKIFHVGGGTLSYSNPRKTFLNFRNSLAMLLKNESKKHVIWKFFARLILDGLAGGYFLSKGEFRQILAVIQAHFSLYKHLPALLYQRRLCGKRIDRIKIGDSRVKTGRYPGSIVYAYYLKGIRKFYLLPGADQASGTNEEALAQSHLLSK